MADVISRSNNVGLFFSAAGAMRAEFQSGCGEMFSQLLLADDVDATSAALGRHKVNLLTLDLNGVGQLSELAGIGALIRSHRASPSLCCAPTSTAPGCPS